MVLLQELTDTRFGELHGDTEIDFAQHEVKTGVTRRFGQALRCDPQARKDRLIHASIEQAELERVKHVERVAALDDRALLSLGRVFHSLEGDQSVDS